ncbi:MAG: carbohydrate ABC transporter substrate-binding protein, partial [Cyanobacteria bacterium J06649_4]
PPACYMHRQANFILTAYPEDKEPRIDYDFFPLPGIDERFGTPLLVAGDALVMFRDTDETRQLMTYLTTPEPYEVWAQDGNFIAPHLAIDINTYPDIVIQRIAQHLQDADVIRFDGSDLMPAAVGTGTFWSAMMSFAEGESAENIVQQIDDTWPTGSREQPQEETEE